MLSFASAVITVDGDWQDGSQSLTITEGENAIFNVESLSQGSENILNVKLYDSSDNLVYAFEDGTSYEDNWFWKSYTINTQGVEGSYGKIAHGNYDVIILGSNTVTLSLTVNPLPPVPNNAPVITSTPITQINEDAAYSYQVTATDADPEDVLSYSLTQNPSWLSIDSSTGLITGTAPDVDSDTDYTIIVMVSDGTDTDTQTYTLTVNNIVPGNNAPSITSSPVTEVYEEQSYSYNVDANDPDSDTLTYSLTQNPTWLSIDSSTGAITGTAPSVSQDIDYSITIQVSDGNGGSDTQTYILTVNNGEEPEDDDEDDNPKSIGYISLEDDASDAQSQYLAQFEPKTIYLDDDEIEQELSWFQKLFKAIKNFFKKLFRLK